MRVLLLFILIIPILLNAQEDSCQIKFQVKGFNTGKVKFIAVFADQNYILDSAMVDENGNFELRRSSPVPSGYFYAILPDYSNFHFMVDEQKFEMQTNKDDLVGQMRTKNTINNQLLYENFKLQIEHDRMTDSLNKLKATAANDKALMDQIDGAFKKMQDERSEQLKYFQKKYPEVLYTKFKTAGQNPDLKEITTADGQIDRIAQLEAFRNDFWDNVDFQDERLLRTPVISNKLKRHITELTPQQPDSIIRQADIIIQKSLVNKNMFQFFSNWIALNYQPTKTKVMDGEAVFVHILEKYFSSKEMAFWASDKDLADFKKKVYEMKSSLLYRKGPDVVSTDFYGNTRSIYEIKADYIVVFMYDPDCDHCRSETPLLREFYKEWKDKSLEVFAIVLNTDDEEWRAFVQKNQIESWINVHDPTNRSIYAKYYVDITPELYVLNKDRIIIGKNLKVAQIATVIEQDKARAQQNH